MDITRTLLDAAGHLLRTSDYDGQSLLPVLTGSGPLAEKSTAFVSCIPNRAQWALFSGPWNYVRRTTLPSRETREWLFHITVDPQEKLDLSKKEPQRLAQMRADLRAWLALDPNGSTLESPPSCEKLQPENWQAPADWARAK